MEEAQVTFGRQILRLGSDLSLRHVWFSEASFSHPAKLHLGLLQWIVERYTRPGDVLGDPMAGIGSILLAATLQRNVVAREIEPRWLAIAHDNAGKRGLAGYCRTCKPMHDATASERRARYEAAHPGRAHPRTAEGIEKQKALQREASRRRYALKKQAASGEKLCPHCGVAIE